MGIVLKISKNKSAGLIKKELDKLKFRRKKPKKEISDYYGSLPDTFKDGLVYQKEVRNEWK